MGLSLVSGTHVLTRGARVLVTPTPAASPGWADSAQTTSDFIKKQQEFLMCVMPRTQYNKMQ